MIEKPNSVMPTIKVEHTDTSDNEENDKRSNAETPTPSAKPYQIDSNNSESSISSKAGVPISLNTLNTATITAGADTKYCHVCDIKFNYLNTFIAHKQFYCKNIQNDLDATTANAATAVISKARSSPNQTSVVT